MNQRSASEVMEKIFKENTQEPLPINVNRLKLATIEAIEAERQRCEGLEEALKFAFHRESCKERGLGVCHYCIEGIKKMEACLPSPTSAVESKKPLTQEPNPKHIIFNGRVYGLLEEGCYTMKNPVQVVEKPQEPSLLERMAKALDESEGLIQDCFDCSDCGVGVGGLYDQIKKLLAEYDQTKEKP